MVSAAGKSAKPGNGARSKPEDLESDIAQLKADIAQLAEHLKSTGEHTYGAARRAAVGSARQVRAEGEATVENLRARAEGLELQIANSVRDKPMTALGVAACVGFLVAVLARR